MCRTYPKLLLFIGGINANIEITEEIVSVHRMHRTTTGMDIFRELQMLMDEYNLVGKKLKCIATNGDSNMFGK